jgi:exopolyphosphatase/pppGpp-phosphohydrolase
MRVLLAAPLARRASGCLPPWFATALALLVTALPAAAAERRGGIEIGAKGVKATVLELDTGPSGPTSRTIMTEVSNTTVAAGVVGTNKYSAGAIRETAAEAGKFAKQMREQYGVPSEKIQVIGSSGLPGASNRNELVEAVREATGLAPLRFITPCEEVGLIIAGLLAEPERSRALLVDIGSGNTKGGYLGAGGQTVCFSVPFGSVTFADRVKKDAPGQAFADAADQLRPTRLEAPLVEEVRANPELAARSLVILSGGAAYAMVTLMEPEKVRQDRVTFAAREIADYLQRLKAAEGIPRPDLDAIADPAIRAAAEKEVQNVADNFTRENLIAGAEVLTALSSAFKFEGKTLIFDRNGITAWIRAAVSPPVRAATGSTPALPRPAQPYEAAPRPPVSPATGEPLAAPEYRPSKSVPTPVYATPQ